MPKNYSFTLSRNKAIFEMKLHSKPFVIRSERLKHLTSFGLQVCNLGDTPVMLFIAVLYFTEWRVFCKIIKCLQNNSWIARPHPQSSLSLCIHRNVQAFRKVGSTNMAFDGQTRK